MSMTESEAIAKCQSCNNLCPQAEMACEIAKGRMNATNELVKCQKELEQYRAIGTVSEFRELKEKATAKKAIVSRSKHEAYCPNCKSVVADDEFWALDEYVHHCECGQAILGTDWSEEKE